MMQSPRPPSPTPRPAEKTGTARLTGAKPVASAMTARVAIVNQRSIADKTTMNRVIGAEVKASSSTARISSTNQKAATGPAPAEPEIRQKGAKIAIKPPRAYVSGQHYDE